jgi:hypothetical protein
MPLELIVALFNERESICVVYWRSKLTVYPVIVASYAELFGIAGAVDQFAARLQLPLDVEVQLEAIPAKQCALYEQVPRTTLKIRSREERNKAPSLS